MVVPRQPKAEPNLLFIAYDLLKGRPDNRDQRASQSTATIKLEHKTTSCEALICCGRGGAASNQYSTIQYNTKLGKLRQ